MKHSLFVATLMVLFAAGVFIGSSMAQAVTAPLTTKIESDAEPIDALLIPPAAEGTRDHALHRAVKVISRGPAAVEVRVEAKPEDFVPGMLYTIFSRSSDGLVVASPLKLVMEYETAPITVKAECGTTGLDGRLTELPDESLKKLVEIREKKIELLFERLQQQLEPATVKKLAELEKTAGLSYPREFSRDLPRTELITRLLTLNALIQARASQSVE